MSVFIQFGDKSGHQVKVTVSGILALGSNEALQAAIAEKFSCQCKVESSEGCLTEKTATFEIDSDCRSKVQDGIREAVAQTDRAGLLAA